MSNQKMKNVALAACVASAFAFVAPVMAGGSEGAQMVACSGVNSCKGLGSCKTAMNSCKGQNSCKGMGMVMMSSHDCTQAGGAVVVQSRS